MSVYKPGKGRFWHYDFQYQGRRYHGSTGATTRSKAERVEEVKRVAAARGELNRPAARRIPTLDDAATIWWQTKAHLETADELQDRASVAVELIGKTKPVNEVAFSDIIEAIQRRRGRLTRSKRPPTNATINRDIVATIRPILKLARKMLNDGKGEPVAFPEIDWAELTLPEPKPKPKNYSRAEVAKLFAAVPLHLEDFARMMGRYGLRLSEMFFGLADVDPVALRLTIHKRRKNGQIHALPLMPEDAAMLAARIGRARAAGLDTPWFREEAGELVPITYWHAQKRLGRAVTDTGLRASKGARGAHDLRHDAGMQMLRKTGNLRITQKLLGHSSMQSTLVYAHAMEEDLRDALAAVSRSTPEVDDPADGDASEKPAKTVG